LRSGFVFGGLLVRIASMQPCTTGLKSPDAAAVSIGSLDGSKTTPEASLRRTAPWRRTTARDCDACRLHNDIPAATFARAAAVSP